MLPLSSHITTPGPRWLLLLTLALAPLGAPAVEVADLYAAAIAVPDRDEETRLAAFRDALAAVMVKVSGNRRIAGEPAAFEVLEQAPLFVQQYRYTDEDELWAGFDGAALERVMRGAGLPVWGRDRPGVLLWLAVDWGGGSRGVVSAADDNELRRAIEAVAASRGLPLVLPLFDSTDREQMTFSDLWGGFTDKIDAASARYGAAVRLIGRASRGAGSRLFVRWELDLGGVVETWQGGLSDGLHRAADEIAARFAARGSGLATRTLIAVSGIGSLADYGRASSYLEGLSIVSGLAVDRVTADTVVFGLELRGDPGQLVRVVDLGRVLEPDVATGASGTEGLQHYRLLP